MRLKRFKARRVHGYLDFNLLFKSDLTFLTGINGTGKTSILNCIVALITPDLSKLSSLSYEYISVEIEHEGRKIAIDANSDEEQVVLAVSGVSVPYSFDRFVPDPDLPVTRQLDRENEHYKELSVAASGHPVMRFIASLPTPMFLGLDRRSRFDTDDRRLRSFAMARHPRLGRNVFGGSLGRSVFDAAELAETKYRDALISSGRVAERLQTELLLGLITFASEDFDLAEVPTAAEVAELDRLRRDAEELPAILRISKADVHRRIVPFVESLQRVARDIPQGVPFETIVGQKDNSKIISAMIKWNSNKSQISRIRVISEVVSRYNLEKSVSLSPTEKYLSLLNEFLEDSGKHLAFDERGYLHVEIDGVAGPKDISCLSSGEAQIFVILTHLAFNPFAQEANIFIIDEPELSLHVRWQELFVDSVMSANSNIQYIMATHSPSIILEKTKFCLEIGQKKRRRGSAKASPN